MPVVIFIGVFFAKRSQQSSDNYFLCSMWSIYELNPEFILSCIVIVVVSLAIAKPSAEIETKFYKVMVIKD